MKNPIDHLFSWCRQASFGEVRMNSAASEFYHNLNNQILYLCKTLPEAVQTDALLLFLKDPRDTIGENINFFRYYAKPSWSAIFWLTDLGHQNLKLKAKDTLCALKAHAMAMFLHAVDDHLSDGELALNHLTLLIRSQAWLEMQVTLRQMAKGIDRGEHIISGFMNQYYATIENQVELESLDQYCDLFRSQMGTAYIVPCLLIRKISTNDDFYSDFVSAYGSFGVAWRLLDDLNDVRQDMDDSRHSAIYCCLPEELKLLWNRAGKNQLNYTSDIRTISEYLYGHQIVTGIAERICTELGSAAEIVAHLGLNGLAHEFRQMSKPLESFF